MDAGSRDAEARAPTGTPLVSICVPCYNAQEFVAAALRSALAQTYTSIEVIAINDGSTDETASVLECYRHLGVQVIEQPNAGASAARNRAFALSQGAHLLFLDADDLISPGHVAALRAVLPTGSRHIAMSQWARFITDPDQALFIGREGYRDLPGPEWLAADWRGGAAMTQPGMFLIPRSLIEENGGWNESLSLIDDFEFFARIIARSDGVRYAEGARLYYRSGVNGSLSGRKSRTSAESACRSLLLGTQHLLEAANGQSTRLAAANILQTFIYDFYPRYPDLRASVRNRIAELGGSDLQPAGPPGFQQLRPWIGWRAARAAQLAAERLGLNRAARSRERRRRP